MTSTQTNWKTGSVGFGEEKDCGVVVRIWKGDLNFWFGKTEHIRSMCRTAIRIPSRKLNCDVEGSQP
jgi:hypothetical protein